MTTTTNIKNEGGRKTGVYAFCAIAFAVITLAAFVLASSLMLPEPSEAINETGVGSSIYKFNEAATMAASEPKANPVNEPVADMVDDEFPASDFVRAPKVTNQAIINLAPSDAPTATEPVSSDASASATAQPVSTNITAAPEPEVWEPYFYTDINGIPYNDLMEWQPNYFIAHSDKPAGIMIASQPELVRMRGVLYRFVCYSIGTYGTCEDNFEYWADYVYANNGIGFQTCYGCNQFMITHYEPVA